MFKLAPLSTRNQFGKLLTERGLLGEAVEVGTHRGEFAHVLLSTWRGHLHCVDPWSPPPGYEDQQKLLWGDGDHFEACKRLLQPFGGRVTYWRMTSEQAVEKFQDNSLHFGYVDGDHRKQFALQDLTLWWEKIVPGGILAGHDWIQPGEQHRWAEEIQDALHVFLTEVVAVWEPDLDVELIAEEGGLPWSFYMEKPR